MKKYIAILIFLFILIIVLGFAKLVLQNELSNSGDKYQETLTQLQQLEKENVNLKNQIFYNSAYTTVAQKAGGMGFIEGKPKNVLYITGR